MKGGEKMRKIIAMIVVAVLGATVATLWLPAQTRANGTAGQATEIKGDHYFNFGTTFHQVIWTLQRRYPEFQRTFTTDNDGYTDLVEYHNFIFFHYYFKDHRYIGSTTTFHKINKANAEDKHLFNGLVTRLKKLYGVEPRVNEAKDTYEWEDRHGNEAVIDLISAPADTFITVRSMAKALVEHPIL